MKVAIGARNGTLATIAGHGEDRRYPYFLLSYLFMLQMDVKFLRPVAVHVCTRSMLWSFFRQVKCRQQHFASLFFCAIVKLEIDLQSIQLPLFQISHVQAFI